MKIKINTDVFKGYNKGQIIDVPDTNGVPNDQFWRRRLADSEIDNNCEVVSGDFELRGEDE